MRPWNGVRLPYLTDLERARVRREVGETMTTLREERGPDRAPVPARALASVVFDALMRGVSDTGRAALVLAAAFGNLDPEHRVEWAQLVRVEEIMDRVLADCRWIAGAR